MVANAWQGVIFLPKASCFRAWRLTRSLLQITELASFYWYVSDLRSRVESHLAHVLLAVTLAEMAIYRLLVPSLRPQGDVTPPWWHTGLTYLGLFLFYFASALAVGVIAHQVRELFAQREGRTRLLVWVLTPVACFFLVLASLSIVAVPSDTTTFLLEAAFVATVILVVLVQLLRGGDIGARIGLLLIALPLVVHFYAPLSVRYLAGEEALWNGVTDDVEQYGRWLVLTAAIAMPYCFGARPFIVYAARIPPVLAALGVGVMGATLVRHNYAAGMQLAQNGLGFSIKAAAPGSLIALCLLALSALTWTLVNCLSAPTESRRRIGIGIALVVAGGYAFAWPLQYLAGIAGLLTIAQGTAKVREQERDKSAGARIVAIDDEPWQGYVTSVLEALQRHDDEVASTAVTIRGDADQSRSHFTCQRQGLDVTVTVERIAGSVIGLDVRVGKGSVKGPPSWTLHARQVSPMGAVHPRPPDCGGRRYRDSDSDFVEAFEIFDDANWSESILSEGMRTRLRAEVQGWVAIWANGTLRFQVYPGRGAPLDRPIPISELAFQSGKDSPDAMVSLLDLLAELAALTHALAD